jgi:hypothetical protein
LQDLEQVHRAQLFRAFLVFHGDPGPVLRIVAANPVDFFIEFVEVELAAPCALLEPADPVRLLFIRVDDTKVPPELVRGGVTMLSEMTMEGND